MDITFSNTFGVPEDYSPKPASSSVPDWYKDLESYISGKKKPTGDGNTTATIKRCMPVFDAITSGYILYTQVDIQVTQRDNLPYFHWSDSRHSPHHQFPWRNSFTAACRV